jgi:hypothetical protein
MPKRVLIHGHNRAGRLLFDRSALGQRLRSAWLKCRSSSFNTGRTDNLYVDSQSGDPPLLLHYWDITDATDATSSIGKSKKSNPRKFTIWLFRSDTVVIITEWNVLCAFDLPCVH